MSFVTSSTVKALDLVSVGRTNVGHGGGSEETSTYMVNILLPNRVQVVGALVAELPKIIGDFGAIIGMDIITQGDLSITNTDGQTWMTFRTPSVKRIDYVEEANRMLFARVGRNDPCPCGNKDSHGRPVKFKNSHGRRS